MKTMVVVLVIGFALLISGCITEPKDGSQNDIIPKTVLDKYNELGRNNENPFLGKWTKDNQTIYTIMTGKSGDFQTEYFYDKDGNLLEAYEFSPFYTGGPAPQTNVSGYDYHSLMSWSQTGNLPVSVSNKFTELNAVYNQSLGTRLSVCTKTNETIYMVDGSGGFSGETYYYDGQGNQLGTYYWDDVIVPNEPRSPINISAYSCIVIRESNAPSTTSQNFSNVSVYSTKDYLEKTIASGSYAKAVAGYGNCNEPYTLILLNATEPIGESIQWFSQNYPNESILSWWDYGNTLDCAGLKSVISTKSLDDPNILEVAHLLVQGNETELGNFMSESGLQYILLSDELVKSPDGSFGGKYWALNYLACARNKKVNLTKAPTTSACEINNSPMLANGPFYQSILYKAIVLGNVNGFQKVYDKNGVKIFKFLPAN